MIGSREELAERATRGLEQLEELHRPWIDNVRIRCDCGAELTRIPEVGDAWLDAGIVPFSTLGWENPQWIAGATRPAPAGLSGADLPDHAYWEQWFPGGLGLGDARADPPLVLLAVVHVGDARRHARPTGRCWPTRSCSTRPAARCTAPGATRSRPDEALEPMGADVMRWCTASGAEPEHPLRLRPGARREAAAADSLELRLVPRHLREHRGLPARPLRDLRRGRAASNCGRSTAGCSRGRSELVEDATAGYERFWTPQVTRAFEDFVEDLSNWYIRRSRRRFYSYDEAAFRTLWYALVQAAARGRPRDAVPGGGALARARSRGGGDAAVGLPRRLAGGGAGLRDEELLAEIDEVRAVVELGRQVRSEENVKNRQPLRRAFVFGAGGARRHAEEIAEELRVKEVAFEPGRGEDVLFKPNLPLLGPRLGKELPKVREALAEGRVEELPDGRLRVAGHELSPDGGARRAGAASRARRPRAR